MMGAVLVFAIFIVAVLVMGSGVWVAIVLFTAVRRMKPAGPGSSGSADDSTADCSGKREPVDGSSAHGT